MKLVSIIIPTYKRPNMIARAVNSALNQTYNNIEVIVVDDNNPNTLERTLTEQAMLEFKNTPNVLYIQHSHNKNGSAARNTGWRASKGDFITFLDDDDEIATSKIEKQVNCLDKLDSNWGACYTSYHILKPNGVTIYSKTNSIGDVYTQTLMRTLYLGSGSNLLLRRRILEQIDGYDESFLRNQDVEFMARVAEISKFAFVPEDLLTVHYEIRQFKRTFKFVDEIAINYTERFSDRIHCLSKRDQRRIKEVISLDRARVALNYKEYFQCVKILHSNHVRLNTILRYIIYLTRRSICHVSYGFYLH